MRILIGVDDSEFSLAAVESVSKRVWPKGTEVKVVTAIEPFFSPGHTIKFEGENLYESARHAAERAVEILHKSANNFDITTEIVEGSAKHVILDESEKWGADLIVVGSHGKRGLGRFLLGSVSQSVALHAKCSVEIFRAPMAKTN